MSARNSIKPGAAGTSKRTTTAVVPAPDSVQLPTSPAKPPLTPPPPEQPSQSVDSAKPDKKPSLTPKKGTATPAGTKKKQSKVRKTPKKRKKKPVKRKNLDTGTMVKSAIFKWEIKKKLGSGGFGDVYKVVKIDNLDKKEYAMKTEMVAGEKRLLRLKIEVSVLEQCQAAEPARRKHFVEYVDKGVCADQFKFVVMGLVGPSIEDIRVKILEDNYTPEAAMNIAIQTLKSVADLHYIGWLHRDIKPQNFAVGLEEDEPTIFMLDFGIARSIFNPGTRVVKTPRVKVKFLGTIRFASRACHKMLEQGRKDDLEAWLYMVVDLFDWHRGLPWKKKSKDEVLDLKEKFFKKKGDFSPKGSLVPKELWSIVQYIDGLKCADEPNYGFIEKVLTAVANDNKIDWKKKAEWIGKRAESDSSSASEASSDNKQSGSASDTTGVSDKKNKSKKKMKKPSRRKNRSATKEGTREATIESKEPKPAGGGGKASRSGRARPK